jgi:hypothetical protein
MYTTNLKRYKCKTKNTEWKKKTVTTKDNLYGDKLASRRYFSKQFLFFSTYVGQHLHMYV